MMAPNIADASTNTDKKTAFDLALLPNELLEKIFSKLDLRTWLSVRLVSSRFNTLATTKDALSNFRISMSFSSGRGNAVITRAYHDLNSLPFTNIKIDLGESPLSPSLLKTLLKSLDKVAKGKASSIRSLECLSCPCCHYQGSKVGSSLPFLLPFLNYCADGLERLGVIRLTEAGKLISHCEEGLALELPNLREVIISFDIVDVEYGGDDLWRVLDLLCGKRKRRLQRLEILFGDQEEHRMTLESFNSSVISPLLKFLASRQEEQGNLANPLTIAFKGVKGSSIPMNFRALQSLIFQNQTTTPVPLRLKGIPFLSLPTARDLTANPELASRLTSSVISITGTTEDMKMATMEMERDAFPSSSRHWVPPASKFSLTLALPSGNRIYLTHPSHLLSSKGINSITILSENTRASLLMSISDEEVNVNRSGANGKDNDNRGFVVNLLEQSASTLEELRILTEKDKKLEMLFLTQDSINFQGFQGFGCFENLRVLELDRWGRRREDFWELWSLSTLEELALKGCYRLDDVGVTGGSNTDKGRSLGELKNLTHLTISGYWKITDISFHSAFFNLKLKTLRVWDVDEKGDNSVTLSCLQTLQKTPCGKTLEVLEINRPLTATVLELRRALVGARTLKRVELWEGKCPGKKNVVLF